jgi:hypothetical protein
MAVTFEKLDTVVSVPTVAENGEPLSNLDVAAMVDLLYNKLNREEQLAFQSAINEHSMQNEIALRWTIGPGRHVAVEEVVAAG